MDLALDGCCPLCRQTVPDVAGLLDLNPRYHTVRRGVDIVQLNPTEYDVLYIFYYHHPVEVSVDTIIAKVWGAQSDKLGKHVSWYLGRLRNKLRPLNVEFLSVAKRSGLFVMRVNDA